MLRVPAQHLRHPLYGCAGDDNGTSAEGTQRMEQLSGLPGRQIGRAAELIRQESGLCEVWHHHIRHLA